MAGAFGGWGGTWGGTMANGAAPIYGQQPGAFDASRYFGKLGNFDELYWQDNPDQAYRHAVSGEASPDSYYNAWLQRQQGVVMDSYAAANLRQPGLLVSNYLPQAMQDLAHRYTAMASWQQGMNPQSYWPGRRM
jgi:hypothetical protein